MTRSALSLAHPRPPNAPRRPMSRAPEAPAAGKKLKRSAAPVDEPAAAAFKADREVLEFDSDDEDSDDDNDGIADSVDACPRGAVGWPSNLNTDFDNDGCRDGYEDEDDDGDGIPNSIDNCPQSIGIVNAQGCTATQLLDDENGGSSLVYYVCPVGSVVVLDPTDCPVDN